MVGREVSAQPPWSIATSTMTEPGFIALTVAAEISFGAAAPGISTVPITRSARRHTASTASRVENTVRTRAPSWFAMRRSASGLRSTTVTVAPMPDADDGRMRAGNAAAEDDDVGRRHAGHAAEQHAAPAVLLFEAARADMRRHAAGDLRHRRQQRQRALRARHRLVGDGGDAGGDQIFGLRRGRARDADR